MGTRSMTQDGQGIATEQAEVKPTPKRARRWLVAMMLVLAFVVILPIVASGALWLRLGSLAESPS